LVEQERAKDDSDPKAVACYGLVIRQAARASATLVSERMLLRFGDRRPVSSVTLDFLSW
jgi:hypothetical protein